MLYFLKEYLPLLGGGGIIGMLGIVISFLVKYIRNSSKNQEKLNTIENEIHHIRSVAVTEDVITGIHKRIDDFREDTAARINEVKGGVADLSGKLDELKNKLINFCMTNKKE